MDALWTESQKPKSLKDLDYHKNISSVLAKLAQNSNFPHLLFYGPNGAGKKTRIMAFLKEVYGPSVYSVTAEEKEFKISDTSSTTTSCTVLQSKYHIDVAPADAENHDKVIIQKLIKEVASSQQVNCKVMKDFKVVIINEIDNLTKEAQASLRRTMEKYIEKCRLILCCETLAKVIHPIRSRCLLIRVPAPDDHEVEEVLAKIAKAQGINLPEHAAKKLSQAAKGNLRNAIMYFQVSKMEQYPYRETFQVKADEWKEFLRDQVYQTLVRSQTPEALKEIREKMYQLLINCIPADRIILELVSLFFVLARQLPEKKLYIIVETAANCENKAKQGSKHIIHLEAFIANVMVILKEK